MAYAKTSLRAEKRALRDKMRAMGLGYPEIAAELARRYRFRPRAAWREAYGWSLKEAADRINAHSGEVGLDPGGIAAMTAAHLCEREHLPTADLLILDKYSHTQDGASRRAAAGTASQSATSPPAARAAGEAPG